MTGRLASGRAGMRVWAARWLMLALPLPLLVLAAAAFALAPSGIGTRAGARPDLRVLPPTPRASAPEPAIHARSAITGAALSSGGRALSRPRRSAQRRHVGP
jgi:hypothetical protein